MPEEGNDNIAHANETRERFMRIVQETTRDDLAVVAQRANKEAHIYWKALNSIVNETRSPDILDDLDAALSMIGSMVCKARNALEEGGKHDALDKQ
jgi:hypothetical protein